MLCLNEAVLDDFARGRLRDGALAEAEVHLDTCPSCRDVVMVLAGGAPASSSGFGVEAMVEPEIPRGAELGRYLVIEPIGQGAMGRVYLGYDPTLDRRVALKVLRSGREGAPSVTRSQVQAARDERVFREAQALARLSHPNVVAVYEAGRGDAGVFLAMEYVAGSTLRAFLASLTAAQQRLSRVCEAFMQAGEGLLAAHGAGLVHRDFKPENVLVGADGRVRVTDFGLATRHALEGEEGRAPGIAGTPAYMAPEQLRGERATPASDQFSFCVALHEALFGVRPFAGQSPAELQKAMESGEPSRGTGAVGAVGAVPARVAAVVKRGLAARPEERYPSMAELLADLRAATAPRRRALVASIAAMLMLLGASAVAMGAREKAAPDPCAGGDARALSVWSEETKGALERALGATAVPSAAEEAARATGGLDAYARAWRQAYRATCEATAVRHEQSPEVLDARMHCLQRRLDALGALREALSRSDAETLAAAGEAVLHLPALSDCADAVSLSAMDPRPRAPALAARLHELERQLANVDAARLAGRYAEARTLAGELLPEAQAIGHRPTLASTRLLKAAVARRAGAIAEAEAEAREALFAAEAGRDDRTAAEAWLELVACAGERGAFASALDLGRHAEAAIARVGEVPLLAATLHHQRGVSLTTLGKLDEAGKELETARALSTKVLGEAHVDVARTLSALGNLARARGDFEGALSLHRQALAIDARALGEEHPATARHHHNIGGILRVLGKLDEALVSYRRALDLETHGLGARHAATALTRNSIALVYLEKNEPAAARGELSQALEVLSERVHPDRGLVLHNLGLAAQLEGKHEEALRDFDAAEAVLTVALGAGHAQVAAVAASRGKSLRALGREVPGRAAAEVHSVVPAAASAVEVRPVVTAATSAAEVRPAASATASLTPKAPPAAPRRSPAREMRDAYGAAESWDTRP